MPGADRESADQYLGTLNGKPAALVTRLGGRSIERPEAAHCAELGALLGRMHLAGRSYSAYLENPRGPKWWRFAAKEVFGFLQKDHPKFWKKNWPSRPRTAFRTCRAARCTRISSETTRCSRTDASPA